MSEPITTTTPAVVTEPAVVEPTVAVPETAAPATTEPAVAPVEETKAEEPVVPAAVPAEETAVAEEKAEDKVIEPITEGQLSYKGPGLVKSLIPSKKEFWLSDEALTPESLDLYLRGEKPEIAHPVVAWASQTGKGLLFFNKKGDTNRAHPHSILALYDATDLKKSSSHEITFRLHGHPHTLKASNDAERDGWYLSLEKAHELGKAEKETVPESEGYKAELEKLSKPAVAAAAAGGAAGALRSKSQGKKSAELDRAQREGSDVEEEDAKKTQKSRSTSRGMLNRLKGKKEEIEAKHEEKKEEEKEAEKAEPAAVEPAAPVTDAAVVAPIAGLEQEPAVEPTTAEEKPKLGKRNSIFGKMQGWGGLKSPSKEKEAKDAELKPEVPAKDEAAPQIPESVTAEATTEPIMEATPAVEPAKEVEPASPAQSRNFLSGLPFMNKRNRSVSPSAVMKETPKSEETAEPVVAPETAVTEPVAEPTALPEVPVEDSTKTETPVANKRQSIFGNLGRRASKALNRSQAPKKEAPTTASETAAEDTAEVAPAETETPVVNGTSEAAPVESEPAIIGDVVPEAVNVGQPQSTPTVTASA